MPRLVVTTTNKMHKKCQCGHEESNHVDGFEKCYIPECGCKEFEPRPVDDIDDDSDLQAEAFRLTTNEE